MRLRPYVEKGLFFSSLYRFTLSSTHLNSYVCLFFSFLTRICVIMFIGCVHVSIQISLLLSSHLTRQNTEHRHRRTRWKIRGWWGTWWRWLWEQNHKLPQWSASSLVKEGGLPKSILTTVVVVVVLGEMVVVTVSGAGVVGLTVTSALARTIGRAKAEMTMPVVTK